MLNVIRSLLICVGLNVIAMEKYTAKLASPIDQYGNLLGIEIRWIWFTLWIYK